MSDPNANTPGKIVSARRPMLLGYVAVLILVGVVGVWSVQTRIAGAVIASGLIQVESNRQVLQHPTGGVVGELLARDGDTVAAGEVVLRFDDRQLRTELSIVVSRLDEVQARRARLVAERDTAIDLTFDPRLLARASEDGAVARLIEGQRNLFEIRRETLSQELTQLDKQIDQIGDQIIGVRAQLEASRSQAALIEGDLENARALFDSGFTQRSRVNDLEREEARLRGLLGELQSQIAQLEGNIAALEIEKLRLAGQRRERSISELRDLSLQEIELAERMLSLEDQLAKMEVRSPVPGVIYGSRVFAEQTVISPAEPMMFIVPQDQPLVVSARVEAIHIDQVHVGQEAALRFVAFDQRFTSEIFGVVTRLSADAFTDEITGMTYYRAELVPLENELDKLGDQVLLPGMPVEAFIRTADRTPLSYLLSPMTDYFYRAFRET